MLQFQSRFLASLAQLQGQKRFKKIIELFAIRMEKNFILHAEQYFFYYLLEITRDTVKYRLVF